MSEQQISKFTFNKDALHSAGCECGGGYRVVSAEIHIDSQADEYTQKIALIHEVLGVYLGSVVPADTLTEIAEQVVDGLETLGVWKPKEAFCSQGERPLR